MIPWQTLGVVPKKYSAATFLFICCGYFSSSCVKIAQNTQGKVEPFIESMQFLQFITVLKTID